MNGRWHRHFNVVQLLFVWSECKNTIAHYTKYEQQSSKNEKNSYKCICSTTQKHIKEYKSNHKAIADMVYFSIQLVSQMWKKSSDK